MNNNSGLGRGLGSLIPNKQSVPVQNGNMAVSSDDKNKIFRVSISDIETNPLQPRKRFVDARLDELVASIKEYGVIQPLIVSRKGNKYELIAGERRLRASKMAGLTKLPVIVRDADDKEKLEVALIENIQRENLNPIDLGGAYKELMDKFQLTQDEVAKQMGKSRSSVANTIRMLGLPAEIKLALIEGKITEGHAKYLIGLDSETKQMSLFRKILHGGLSVQDTSGEARQMGGTKRAKIQINYQDKDKEFALREFFGAKAEVKRKAKGAGQIIIHFYSDDELREIMSKVNNK
ncbi:hypothetical protein A2331_00940 [Candidatus Falkowbacteria bacterium RIFOXYB2_FULL_34_18]|uniref:ParB-like N-terminal domain-containing protein n=1 Tax=Candidatus Falkowbacteria bacterium RIFOXYD2_FULL_34_120 TaxID=1798007 RepID=A0A1F5TSH4_9BACT|nr:MAG: hypothetical protein A2331_00940 [Candidatus Falkowbacteria bacterium RIFOXYB2_FULL_34_18]OGF30187.1 MAG: hypothetical protein A2500_02170 [Candidatus Falkowbacteria bacterium RIFOXYC12_FULL_34_55]OGF37664.1 MAG: hypothetical protein A2466_05495 [Candidatus Falkowbacteria bacterium RIFOXYC2_FULL_34_220]OGF39391.1 MAG: hypothetical protein A2515_02725 [Candidatus Falkowbacteria bacterium RIFOXYD12_FULL_34_57]OGF41920.1 MAG: hypothetical protein A2531_04790 [Candidatus Falkowbacteria bact